MITSEVQRTLVKSPPELWAELSDPTALARHLGELGEIQITRTEPEHTIEWKADNTSGTVAIKGSGWGTRVTLTVTRELDTEPDEPPATAADEAEPDPATAARTAPTAAEPEPAEPEPAEPEPSETEPSETEASDPEASEPMASEPVETVPTAERSQDGAIEETTTVSSRRHVPAPRPGFFARLFRRQRPAPSPRTAAADPPDPLGAAEERRREALRGLWGPAQATEQEEEFELQPEPERAAAAETAEAAETAKAPEMTAAPEMTVAPEQTVAPAGDTEPAAEASSPSEPEQAPARDLAAELRAAEEAETAAVTAVLTAALDRLGAAHHRPFSRS